MTEYINGEIEDTATVAISFKFSVGADGKSVVSDLFFCENRITLEEENRGDYRAWK
jgi:hypothetical protein